MAKTSIIWSNFQKSIFDNVQNDEGNLMVVARAGASKTSSIVESIKHIPKGKKVLLVSFNRKIAEELDNRISKSYCLCSTIHSCGVRAIKTRYPKIKIDPEKSSNLTNLYLKEQGFKQGEKLTAETSFALVRTLNLCKSTLKDTPTKIDEMLDQFDIETILLDRDDFIKAVIKLLRKCKEETSCIDYSDMIWWPNCYNIQPEQYDRVFIDETQDLSPAQINIAINSCKKDGRITAVGDDRQVVYSWAGAEIDVVSKITKRLNAKVLPLPISYRCPKSIIKLAQTIVPDIQAAPNAKEGAIHHITEDQMFEQVQPGDFILSRVNAPLIYHCLKLIRAGKSSNIQGRDIANGLLFLIKKSETKNLNEFKTWLDNWETSESKRLRDKGRDPILITDKAACLRNICADCKSLDEVSDKLKELFRDGDDDKDRIMLSTIHRSKGLERNRVFILEKTLRQGMNIEEDNLCYIAWTRSKDQLFLVE